MVICQWGLRASLKAKTSYWKITKYDGPHTCISTYVGIDHKNLNNDMVAHTLLGVVRCDPSYEIKYIIENVKDKNGYQISYTKAWRNLKRAMEIAYGTWESSVQLLPKYMCALSKYNPGTAVEWKHLRANTKMSKTLNYVFWAFIPCVDGFRHCRKIISVNGTHLYTKYKHKMFIGVTLDANNQVLPLAFAIVDEETSYSWKWFLENLGRHVVSGENCMCLISDRHKGIVRVIKDLPYFQFPYGVHRFCLRHVCSNFNIKFKDVHLKDLRWAAGTQNQFCKFEAIIEAIKQRNIMTHRYLAGIAKEKWSLAHDGGWHRGLITTKMSECLNSVLKGARRLPIYAIVHLTLLRCVQYFIERVTRGGRMVQENQLWSDYACRKYEKWARKSIEHCVAKYDVREQTASVATVGRPSRGQHMQVVKLSTSDCSCSKWTIFGIPCSHAICTAKWHSLDLSTLVQPWYNISEYLATYEDKFQPLADERYWDPPTFELHHNPVRRERRRVGKDRTTQLRNDMDTSVFRERQHR
ncbi:uncharacterized protein LOC142519770 [Primulina tabacum]|uniref:uncharacterized protein LOC142519770 n=1 Tax=Primulina tabacum TaxID=48773 RepID=UPI003F59ECD5